MNTYNEDELDIPTWLNRDFLEEVLSKYENELAVEVVDFDLSPATLRGDHYASIMYRAKVNYKLCPPDGSILQISLIVKTVPEEEGKKREMLMRSSLFETEISMYEKTLPKIEEVLAQYGDNTKFAPKLIYHSLNPHKVIILEDLCVSGYTCVRGRNLTEDEVRIVYQKLAKLHAVTYMLGHSENHSEVTQYQSGIFSVPGAEENPFIASGIKNFIDMISEHEDLNKYLPKIKALEPEMFKQCMQLYKAYQNGGKDEIFVLNHGDFHLKNMMFQFNSKAELEDFQLVDFQISVYAPSIIDVHYSIYMLLSPELRIKRVELIQFYFNSFIEALNGIHYKGEMPKFEDFQNASLKYKHFTLLLLSTFLPLFYSMSSQIPDELKVILERKSNLHQNPAYVAEVRRLLPIYLQEGYLD